MERLRKVDEKYCVQLPSYTEEICEDAYTAIQTLQSRLAESEARGAAVRKVRDGYASQEKFADNEQAAHFREFVRRLDAVFLASPEKTHG